MSLIGTLSNTLIRAENVFYRLTFPGVGDVIDGGQSAIEDGGVMADASAKVDELGGGASNITYKAIVWLFVIGLMVAAATLFFSNSGDRADKKTSMITKVIAAVLAFAAVGIITLAATIGGGLF